MSKDTEFNYPGNFIFEVEEVGINNKFIAKKLHAESEKELYKNFRATEKALTGRFREFIVRIRQIND